ncbi:MFS transporter [Francisella philomiragia]|uniref:Sugar transporter, MFS superfamily n=1 Tax=Francisella philomiragia subsp. philomiragia (strain ATCC 25017 / CCUG 19701 / FSC 153 / O\|nr:MFS transporter [Francisella philomiragia]AJI46834.1 major Facilitator Superfamily protein [Francisella philomiragia]AJI50042.1 major Facilitator Superfamily protein [Francisella philomiragia]AJI55211.1 major Facilitator Superfamily protein [Francisella philomiragia]MBK2021415.1 MFS transporter [Francisella philomiragia]MBK2031297.1 MFS transporter [Francisella philomiragia]
MKKSYYNILIIFLLFFLALLNYIDRSTLSIANTEIANAFNITPTEMGILLSAFMWPYAIASLPAGYMVDRLGVNKVMLISMIAWSVACVLGGLVIGFYSILLTRILLGLAEAPFFIVATRIIQHRFPSSQRGLMSSIVALGPRLANILAPLILVGLMLLIDWRGMFILLGIIGLLAALGWKLLHTEETIECRPTYKKTQKVSISDALKNKNVVFLCIGNLCSSYAYWLFLTWLPFYFIKVKHLSLSQMSIATSISFISGIASVMLGGIASDIMIKKGFTAVFSRLTPIIIGCLVASIAILALPFIDNIFIIVCVISVTIFCLGLRISPTWALVADISPYSLVGTIGGLQNFANFVGAGLAPLITGIILQSTNDNFMFVFIFSGVICLFGSFIYMLIRNSRVQT